MLNVNFKTTKHENSLLTYEVVGTKSTIFSPLECPQLAGHLSKKRSIQFIGACGSFRNYMKDLESRCRS